MSIGKPLPGLDVPIVDIKTGQMTQTWYEYFQSRHKISLSQLEDVSAAAPVNGQLLVYTSATGKFTLQPVVAQTNGQVLIWNSGSGTWVAGTN